MLRKILIFIMMVSLSAVVYGREEAPSEPMMTWQAAGDVLYNTPVEGEITNEQSGQAWNMTKMSADRIRVRAERLTGNLIPDVNILDSNGQPLASTYGADETYAVAEIEEYTLPAEGNYQILVGRENGQGGVTTGTYRLIVTPLALAPEHPNNNDPIGAITYDTPIEGEIDGMGWRDVYLLTAPAADRVYVRAERISGTLRPMVEIRDTNGGVITTGYTNSYVRNFAETEYTFDAPGEYQIAVTRESDFNGETTGGYRLVVELWGAGEGNPTLAVAPVTLTYETPVAGTLTGAQWYQDYTFTAEAADSVMFEMTRTDNELIPHLMLLGGSGQVIQETWVGETGDQVLLINQLDVPGDYTIRAMREGGQDGYTTGTYELTATVLGSGEGSSALAPNNDRVVAVDTPVTGEITNTRWLETWTWEGQAGQVVNITVTRTDGTLAPQFMILDSNGQNLYEAYPETAFDQAVAEQYTVPAAGTYQIAVYRYNRQNGETTGSYELSVTTAPAQ